MKPQICIAFLLLFATAHRVPAQQNTPLSDTDPFSENFQIILNDMESQFAHVRDGEPLLVDHQRKKSYYNAHVLLEGMQHFSNGSDIILEEGRAIYMAEFGPFFNSESVDVQKTQLKAKLDTLILGSWERSVSGRQWLYVKKEGQFTKHIKLYHFYGDGSGIFVRLVFDCMEKK